MVLFASMQTIGALIGQTPRALLSNDVHLAPCPSTKNIPLLVNRSRREHVHFAIILKEWSLFCKSERAFGEKNAARDRSGT